MSNYHEALSEVLAEAEAQEKFSPSELAGKMDQDLAETRNTSSLPELEELGLYDAAPMVAIPLEVYAELTDRLFDQLELESHLVKTPNYKHSRIRVQLSRPLTEAEKEKFLTDHHTVGARLNTSRRLDDGFLFKLRVSPNRTHVWIDADLPSRTLYNVVAVALDQHFVNVYPTAVRTFTEYHA
jgi:hypothetical protein